MCWNVKENLKSFNNLPILTEHGIPNSKCFMHTFTQAAQKICTIYTVQAKSDAIRCIFKISFWSRLWLLLRKLLLWNMVTSLFKCWDRSQLIFWMQCYDFILFWVMNCRLSCTVNSAVLSFPRWVHWLRLYNHSVFIILLKCFQPQITVCDDI